MNNYIHVLTEDEVTLIKSQLSQLPMNQVEDLFNKINEQQKNQPLVLRAIVEVILEQGETKCQQD